MIRRIGYACINQTLQASQKITTNRGCIKATWNSKGLPHVSALALQNIIDLKSIIEWNALNGIYLYRMSSDIFPWMSEYMLQELPDFIKIKEALFDAGNTANNLGVRLSFHPGQFNILAAEKQSIVDKTVWDLSQHGLIMDLLNQPRSREAKINIHIGGAYGDKQSAIERWIKNFGKLPDSVKTRLTIENDDKSNMYNVEDLLQISNSLNIPIVYDYLHDFCHCSSKEDQQLINKNVGDSVVKKYKEFNHEHSFKLAYDTWPSDIVPTFHFSDSRAICEDNESKLLQHADHIYHEINTFGCEIDIMLEAKAKEKAAIKYMRDFNLILS